MKKEEAFDREKARILNELVNGKQEDVCPECKGEGQIGVRNGATCPKCSGTGHIVKIVKQELTVDEPRSLYQCKGCSVRCQALIPEVCKFTPDRCLDRNISKNWTPVWKLLTALKGKEEGK